MPAQKSSATSVFTAILGTLGFSAAAGVLVTAMVAPAIAVTGITATNTVGIFNSLPEYIELDPGSQQNTIAIRNHKQSDPEAPDAYTTIATIYRQNREEKTLDEISDYLECAAIAGEDRRFYEHGGVDMPSLVRAALGQVTGDDGAGGASTLTMQTVRNILQQQALNNDSYSEEKKQEEIQKALDPTLDRKIKEMKLAIGLEKAYTKDEILQGYLNIAGFGGNTYGVQAAANQYFSVDASEVTIAQAASLIAIVQYPNLRALNNPENYPANQDRRDIILGWMYTEGCITKAEHDEAVAIPVDDEFVVPSPSKVGCRSASKGYGYICDYALHVVDELEALGNTPDERKANWDRGGYQLRLTVDSRLQKVAWDNVHQWAPANETQLKLGAVAVSVGVGTGNIITMAQNKTFDDALEPEKPKVTTAVNFASDIEHGGSQGFQPGSTYKPYVLLAFLDAGNGLNESFNAGLREVNQAEFADSCEPYYNSEGTLLGPPWGGTYTFRNDANEKGSYTVMRGTAASVNSVFIQMAKRIDQCDIRRLAESIGVKNANGNDLITRPSCSIGGCEINIAPLTQAAAYAAIANKGVYCEPRLVSTVVTPSGTVEKGQDVVCGQSQVSPAVANTAAYAMAGVMGGTAAASDPGDGTPYIGKTGTTDASVHTWMVGSSTKVATAVWVGNISGKVALRNVRVNGTSAAVLRHRIFRPLAQAIDGIYPGSGFPAPDPTLLTGTPVEVPNVIGSSLEQAKSAIELVELVFKNGGAVDSDQPAGTVVKTSPGAGADVPRGTTVTVYYSNGTGVAVPGVVGMSRGDAENELTSAGFTVDSQCVTDADLGNPAPPPAIDEVTSQDPPGGSMRTPSSTTVTIRYYQPVCP